MILKFIKSDDAFRSLEEKWTSLLSESKLSSPFLTWQWMYRWWLNYKNKYETPPQLLIITAAENEAKLDFILPLFIRVNTRYGIKFKQIKLLGTDFESSDYLDIICRPDFASDKIRKIFNSPQIKDIFNAMDMLSFNNLKSSSRLYKLRDQLFSGISKTIHSGITSTCPYLPLPENEDALLKSVSKNMKSSLRRTRNKIKKDESFKMYLVENEAELPDLIKALFELHHLRFSDQNKATKFIYEVRGAFHTEMSRYFLNTDILKFFVVTFNDQPIGMLYCLEYNKRLMYMQAGFDPKFAKYALGNQLILFAVNYAIDHNCVEFDFMRGSEAYKYKWTNKVRYLYKLEYARSVKGRFLLQLEGYITGTKSMIKSVLHKK